MHGIELSKNTDALSKMIAVHNFHNAIEITLKSIFLYHEIRAEKQLNIEFETMMSEIDSHQAFKDLGKKLPYRQDMRNLNQIRNLVQHLNRHYRQWMNCVFLQNVFWSELSLNTLMWILINCQPYHWLMMTKLKNF